MHRNKCIELSRHTAVQEYSRINEAADFCCQLFLLSPHHRNDQLCTECKWDVKT